MKTEFRFSEKMRIFAIVSACLIFIGLILGTVFHFTIGGFFNYGGEYSSYNTITVSYKYVEFGSEEEVDKLCKDVFAENGVSSYAYTSGTTNVGGEIEYRFTCDTAFSKLNGVVDGINTKIATVAAETSSVNQSYAAAHEHKALLGGERVLMMGSIALATVVALQLIYCAIRFKLSGLMIALLADAHNIGIIVALLAITRVPVTSSLLVFGVIAVIATAIGTTLMLDRIRRNAKDNSEKKLSPSEISDMSARQNFKSNICFNAFLAIIAALLFALMSISSLSPIAIISPVLTALVVFIACGYGSTFFVPAVYPYLTQADGKIIKLIKPSQKKAK